MASPGNTTPAALTADSRKSHNSLETETVNSEAVRYDPSRSSGQPCHNIVEGE